MVTLRRNHPMAKIRKNTSTLGNAKLTRLRALLDQYIAKPTDNPVEEHRVAGMDMTLMIHDVGFVAWHQHFLAKLENWLVVNGAGNFVPLPYWDPADAIPAPLNNNNTDV